MNKNRSLTFFILLSAVFISFGVETTALALVIFLVFNFFNNLTKVIAFREFLLLTFGINYLLSPLIIYSFKENESIRYGMKISSHEYFSVAIPCLLAFYIGIYLIKNKVFNINISILKLDASLNIGILRNWIFAGMLFKFLAGFQLPTELAFFVYLISTIRFVGAFGLFMVDYKKYFIYVFVVLLQEAISSIGIGMFHDMAMWIIFLTLISFYLFKPNIIIKIAVIFLGLFALFILQSTKADYRDSIWGGTESANFSTFSTIATSKVDDKAFFFSEANIINSITRINQGWIFASTINNMEYTQDFQGTSLIGTYLEAALLPRFLSPDKLKAGDANIFNKYSGHFIGKGTAMGLGIFADGYISYGYFGSIIFAFLFGVLFSVVFKIVEIWSKISSFFFLFFLPILFYAVRPDCETQTILGHIVKSTLVFAVLFMYYKAYFKKAKKIMEFLNFRKNKSLNLVQNFL